MKKVLFATTALVASTGFAAAEVSLSGSAEIGIFDNGTSDAQFHSDMDVTFSLSGESDNGLTFGATIDLDEVGNDDAPLAGDDLGDGIDAAGDNEEHTVFISGSFGTVTMGDTDGALDWALTEVLFNNGSIQDDEEHGGYDGNGGLDGDNDGQVLRYDYSFGAFAVAASAELDDTGSGDDIYGIGFKYDADLGGIDLSLGLGYQDGGATFGDVTGVSVTAAFDNGLTAGIDYWDASTGQDHIGIGVGYTIDALSLSANYGEFGTGNDGFGLTVGYDLGGGAVVQFGYGDSTVAGVSNDTYSLGIAMSF